MAVTEPVESAQTVWRGPESFRPFLVPVEDLEPFPGNPRLGDVAAIRGSLERFGQLKPVVVDGHRIVAGHHVVRAAQELGYTHVAVVSNDFGDEDEQRAFLLADNRVADLGQGYDTALLVEQLQQLAEIDSLHGTGYTSDDVDAYLAELAELERLAQGVEVAFTARVSAEQGMREVVLLYNPEQHERFERWLGVVATAKGTTGVSETMFAAAEIAALQFLKAT